MRMAASWRAEPGWKSHRSGRRTPRSSLKYSRLTLGTPGPLPVRAHVEQLSGRLRRVAVVPMAAQEDVRAVDPHAGDLNPEAAHSPGPGLAHRILALRGQPAVGLHDQREVAVRAGEACEVDLRLVPAGIEGVGAPAVEVRAAWVGEQPPAGQ